MKKPYIGSLQITFTAICSPTTELNIAVAFSRMYHYYLTKQQIKKVLKKSHEMKANFFFIFIAYKKNYN